jgi:hypothetical protein
LHKLFYERNGLGVQNSRDITLLRSIKMLCGTDSLL